MERIRGGVQPDPDLARKIIRTLPGFESLSDRNVDDLLNNPLDDALRTAIRDAFVIGRLEVLPL